MNLVMTNQLKPVSEYLDVRLQATIAFGYVLPMVSLLYLVTTAVPYGSVRPMSM